MNETKTEYREAFEQGVAAAQQFEIEGVPHVILPPGYSLFEREELLDRPVRKKGHLVLAETKSFIAYVNRHKVEAATVLFHTVNLEQKVLSLHCVFDHHTATEAGWMWHSAYLTPVRTLEWKTWTSMDRKAMPQRAFAEFLETNLSVIRVPVAAEVLDMATRIEAKTEVQFLSGVRLDNGTTQLQYEETATAKAGEKGALELPRELTLGLAVFEGGLTYRVDARLKWRIANAVVSFSYELIEPHLVFKAAVQDILEVVQQETGLVSLAGSV